MPRQVHDGQVAAPVRELLVQLRAQAATAYRHLREQRRAIRAERVDGFLGHTGRSILTRLLGVILAALAVQFVADGIKALMAS